MPTQVQTVPSASMQPQRLASAQVGVATSYSRRSLLSGALALGTAVLASSGCSPYPDDGEFLAGIVFAGNFVTGVSQLDRTPAVGRGLGVGNFAPYTLIATRNGAATATAVSSTTKASSPFWTDGKRDPLAKASAQPVIFFDGSCAAPRNYRFDERLDLIRQDRQYPIFSDIPEVLTANAGKAGRASGYSAVVEVIHVSASGDLPCQSIKRFDTASGRLGQDLTEVRREYRLLQIMDPANAAPPLPVQLGFFNQLIVPYVDMGPVPLTADGTKFATMPLYKATDKLKATQVTVFGTAQEVAPMVGGKPQVYSPICMEYTLTGVDAVPPPDVTLPVYATLKASTALSSCLVCKTVDVDGNLDCPFARSQLGMP